MALVSFPTPQYSSRLISSSLPYNSSLATSNAGKSQEKGYVLRNFQSPTSYQPLVCSSFSSRNRRLAELVPFDAKNSGSGEEDHRALETVLKLYDAIKNKNILELSDVIGDECRCICNFFSFFQPFQGKMQVLDFFSNLIKSLGDNVELVVKPTFHDGLSVGVSWRFEWNKVHVPLGKGFSFHVLQVYQGKVYIRNVEMFMEPLLHIEPFRLKLMAYVMNIMDRMDTYKGSKSKAKRVVYVLLTLFLIGVSLFLFKFTLHSS
ncbi:hypothetical protein I3760_10G077200 [Carya illinoinensis]|uniref:Transmembrane protein n=1 Tax=Carya illinoinensis TaxID=32201 RepID=A0A8T1PBT8_CARIL|nr:uncharacterized protein LOC122279832 isoform X1 [Carya illinoinensis]KAG2684435.1 hypothetical protein I3760_10G077200 [Carya illinoinensis]KAG6639111.1 hypothetical protein CIPAW_10G078200 [Carya illinoinensis]